jgi:biotin operon repressor
MWWRRACQWNAELNPNLVERRIVRVPFATRRHRVLIAAEGFGVSPQLLARCRKRDLRIVQMSRARRLFDLLQLLRCHHRRVSGSKLAETLGISLRALYRDIETLNALGASIAGEAGLGYVLRPGFFFRL